MQEHLIHLFLPASFLFLFVLLKAMKNYRGMSLPSINFRLIAMFVLLFTVTLHVSHLCTLYQSTQPTSVTQLPCCTPTYVITTSLPLVALSLILLSIILVFYKPRLQSFYFLTTHNKSPPYSF